MQVQTSWQQQLGQLGSATATTGSPQLEHVLTALQYLDSTCAALHAELTAEWPTALDNPAMQIDLHSLQGVSSDSKASCWPFAI